MNFSGAVSMSPIAVFSLLQVSVVSGDKVVRSLSAQGGKGALGLFFAPGTSEPLGSGIISTVAFAFLFLSQ